MEDVDKEDLEGRYRYKGLKTNADWDQEHSITISRHFLVKIYET